MIANTMLKKRLRVFANIASENEGEKFFSRNREALREKITFSNLNLNSVLYNSSQATLFDAKENKLHSHESNFNSSIQDNQNIRKKNLDESCEGFESFCLIINFPYKVIEENIYSVLIYYGEVESLVMSPKENGGLEVNVKFYDLRSSKQAYHEILFNFNKLLNTFERGKFSIMFADNQQEIFEKFYLTLNLFDNVEEDIKKIIHFIQIYSKIHKLFSYVDQTPQKKVIIKFFNSKEKHMINFILSRITTTITNKKIIFTSDIFSKFVTFYEMNPKLEENTLDINFNNCNNLDISISGLKIKSGDSIISESKLNTTQNFKTVNESLSTFSPSEFKSFKNAPKTSLNFNKENELKKPDGKLNHIKQKKDCSNYIIIYDKNYTGIQKRNTSDEERKKYIVNINDISNDLDMRTTLMIKNIPSHITQVNLLEKINKNYSTAYNFFYLPIDFIKKTNAGYAFINFRTSKSIINFFLEFDNKPWDFVNNQNKICYISYARIQGFRSICEHFQKSNIMKQVDEKVKPIIL